MKHVLSCNAEESFKTFVDPVADDFNKVILSHTKIGLHLGQNFYSPTSEMNTTVVLREFANRQTDRQMLGINVTSRRR